MHNPSDKISPSSLTASLLQLWMGYEFGNGNTRNTTFILCTFCLVKAYPVHFKYAFLFLSIFLGEYPGAGPAADALHAFISAVGFNVYDQFLVNTPSVPEETQVIATRVVIMLGSWPPSTSKCAGFIAVSSLLATYLVLVAVITVFYVQHTLSLRYGSIFHVIPQLVASEELGPSVSDKAAVVGFRTKGSGKEDLLVKLRKDDEWESIKIRKYAAV